MKYNFIENGVTLPHEGRQFNLFELKYDEHKKQNVQPQEVLY